MTEVEARAQRPVGVVILMVILWIQAVIQMIGGIVLILARNDADVLAQTDLSSGGMLAAGVVAILIGAITAIIANAIGRGSNFARWIVAIIATINLVSGIVLVFSITGHVISTGLAEVVLALITLYILFGERGSKEFFKS